MSCLTIRYLHTFCQILIICFFVRSYPCIQVSGCSEFGLVHGESDLFGNSSTVLLINLEEVREHAFLDVSSAFAESTGNVFNYGFSHVVVEDSAEEFSRLLVVVVGVIVSVSSNCSRV